MIVEKVKLYFDVDNRLAHIEEDRCLLNDQANVLFPYVLECKGNAVEIGSYIGRSAAVIGMALEKRGDSHKLYTIDPHQKGINKFITDDYTTHDLFLENILKAGVKNQVVYIRSFSEDVLQNMEAFGDWKYDIDFLFIDGSHWYEHVRKDLGWIKWVKTGGIIAFHDWEKEDITGPREATIDWMNGNPNILKKEKYYEGLMIFRKC